MYPSASLDAIIRDHFASVSGYVQAGTTVADKAKSMATALVDKHVAWQGIVEVETGTSVEPPTTDQDQFRAALRQREAEFKAEMDKLREENNELRTTERHKNDGSFGQAAAALKNRLDEDEETQPELGAPGLRSALAKLADDEADRAAILDKYKLRGIAEVHLIKTTVLRRIMKGYGVSLMELRPANSAEYGNETGKFVMTKEVFQRLLRSLLRITAAFHPTHREDIMDHFQESLDYLPTRTLQSFIDWSYAVRCQVPLGEWAKGHKSLRLAALILRAGDEKKSHGTPKSKATGDQSTCKQWGTGNCTWGKK
eukprot:g67920.t1